MDLRTVRQDSGARIKVKNQLARLIICTLVGMIVVGLCHSFQMAAFLPLDADRATPAVVAEALQIHGLDALNAWHSTQDNWLLSSILPQFPFYILLGQQPWIPALCGWLSFVTTCAVCGLLAALISVSQSQAYWAGLSLCVVLLLLNPLTLGPIGFLAHPASHGITCFWGLAALIPCVLVLKGYSRWLLTLTTILLLIATISDPWARAAFVLPLTISSMGLALLRSSWHDKKMAVWIAISSVPVWLAGTHGFGLFPGIPGTQFTKGPLTDIPHHVALGFSGIAVMLNIVPGASPIIQSWAQWVSGGILLVLFVLSFSIFRQSLQDQKGGPRSFIQLFCILSISITFVAFSLSNFAVGLDTIRLLGNIAFLLPLYLCCCAAKTQKLLTNGIILTAICGVLAGLVPSGKGDAIRPDALSNTTQLLAFLDNHHLSHGYGGYWSTQANASRLLSNGRVTIRPVAIRGADVIYPREQQVFDEWYRAQDVAPSETRQFFIAQPDDELCENTSACMSLAQHNFGPPNETLFWNSVPIMIWHKTLFPSAPMLEILQRAPKLSSFPAEGRSIPLNPITAPSLLWRGWASIGPDGAWSGAQQAGIMVRLTGHSAPLCLTMRVSGRLSAPLQSVTLRRDDTIIAQWAVHAGTPATYCTGFLPEGDAYLVLERTAPPHDNQRLLPGILLSAISRPAD